ncbi:hypothetical protein Esti_000999 [Eimeria stiedai]
MAPPELGEENMQESQEGALPEWSPGRGKTRARERSEERGVGVDEQKAATATAAAAENDAKGTPTAANAAEDSTGHASDELLGNRTFSRRPTLTLAELPRRVIECQYAVRGPTVALARELSSRLTEDNNQLPFKKLIYVNIGDPQALGQPPISFYRQVLACLMYPPLMGLSLHSNAIESACPVKCPQIGAPLGPRPDFCPPEFKVDFPPDVISRAREYLCAVGSVGAYSHSQGALKLRNIIAQWFTERDGIEAHPDDLFLTDGASAGVARLVEVLHSGPEDGLLVPIPQYPLYAGLLTRIGGRTVGYYLNEESGWTLDVDEVQRALEEARAGGTRVRGLVVINPGNPTGQLIAEDKLTEVVLLCHREGLVLLADEVYQENVYGDTPFVSLRKLVLSLNVDVSLFSFHSSSKGLVGECGFRGGCMLVENVEEGVKQQLYKLSSMSLCSNVFGQLMMCNLCNPPREGEPSREGFLSEKRRIFERTRRKANLVYEHLNAVPGVSCQKIEGSVFGFPKIHIPKRAQEAAAKEGLEPDLFFCLELLKATGIVGVAGSGFGQRKGTYHVRICILPEESLLEEMINKFKVFYLQFVERYNDEETVDTENTPLQQQQQEQ